jgi:hypothetical protein
MHELDRALEQIGDIRSRLVAGTTFQGFGPAVIATTGLLALSLGIAQTLLPGWLAASNTIYLLAWLALAVACTTLVAVEMTVRSRRLHGGLSDAMLVQAVEQFVPAAAAGVVLTGVIFRFAPELQWMLPGLWQLFVALGLFAAARMLVKSIKLIAAWYFVSAFLVLVLCHHQPHLSPWVMAGPFCIGQIAAAICLKYSGDSAHA